jgi:sec-independent protein translocase protein TatA
MALDDPIVWVLIAAVVIFLFGANKIPQFAKAIGQARREFDQASKEITSPSPVNYSSQPTTSAAVSTFAIASPSTSPDAQASTTPNDPLLLAAQQEGIDTKGKTRDQIATEIAWKLKSK